ncbi:MAG: hypothetical protein R8J84_04505 [Mariprofundales bacterium]
MITTNKPSAPEEWMEVCCPDCSKHYRFKLLDSTTPKRFLCHECHCEFQLQSTTEAPLETCAPESVVPTISAHPTPTESITPATEHDTPIPPTIATDTEESKLGPDPSTTSATENAAPIPPTIHPTKIPTPPPPMRAPEPPVAQGKLWPWLLLLLLLISGIGFWFNQTRWLEASLPLTVRAWWAPQRSIGWEIDHIRPQWLPRDHAPPLLAIALQLHNRAFLRRAAPPVLLTLQVRNPQQPSAGPQLVALTQQPSLVQLSQIPWQPPENDHRPIGANGHRGYTIILDHTPKFLESVELALN